MRPLTVLFFYYYATDILVIETLTLHPDSAIALLESTARRLVLYLVQCICDGNICLAPVSTLTVPGSPVNACTLDLSDTKSTAQSFLAAVTNRMRPVNPVSYLLIEISRMRLKYTLKQV